MPTRRFKTKNNGRIRNFSKKAARKIQNEFIDAGVIGSVGSTIQSNDTNMTVLFPSHLVYEMVTSAQSNFIFNIKHDIIKENAYMHYIGVEFLVKIEQFIYNGNLTDNEGYVSKAVHDLLNYTYDTLLGLQVFGQQLLAKSILQYSSTYKLIVADSTTEDIVGQSNVYVTAGSTSSNIYENISVGALGNDSMDASSPGLTANEAYRLFFFNGERFQQIQATYNTDESSANPGQFGANRLHVLSTATLGNSINKI